MIRRTSLIHYYLSFKMNTVVRCMNCKVCDSKGKIVIEKFGRTKTINCYVCEGAGKVEQCTECNGAGEKIIEAEDSFSFSPCLVCMGHGVIPAVKCNCNGKGYIWVQVGYDEPQYEPQPCGCNKGSE
jgi:DnaJ-class molecular chaperone